MFSIFSFDLVLVAALGSIVPSHSPAIGCSCRFRCPLHSVVMKLLAWSSLCASVPKRRKEIECWVKGFGHVRLFRTVDNFPLERIVQVSLHLPHLTLIGWYISQGPVGKNKSTLGVSTKRI